MVDIRFGHWQEENLGIKNSMTSKEKDIIQDRFMDFWDANKEKLGLGEYSDEITSFWFGEIERAERKATLEVINDMVTLIFNRDSSISESFGDLDKIANYKKQKLLE